MTPFYPMAAAVGYPYRKAGEVVGRLSQTLLYCTIGQLFFILQGEFSANRFSAEQTT
ncbi:hypothetical protein TRIP_E160191 [uncultured Spirochaetota bacterium]|nr:hypothetical protein TRIP_E160191 [uncultured Spirochaetota bacterium]